MKILVKRYHRYVDPSMTDDQLWDKVRDGNKSQNNGKSLKVERIRKIVDKKRASKKQSQMTAEEKIASVHIDFDKDNYLPELDEDALKEIGLDENKPVLVKASTIKRNAEAHPEVKTEDIDKIIGEALYSPQYLFKGNEEKPYYSFAKPMKISRKDGSQIYGMVLLDVDNRKDNFEVVHWHWVRARNFKGNKK